MKRLRHLILVTAAALLAVPGLALAAQKDIGAQEYDANCAVCHGATGKGDGAFAAVLKTPVPSLRVLSKNNGGVFPFKRVYQAIDGRELVAAHGPRDMPIWGDAYDAEAITKHGQYYGELYADGLIRARILALIAYINSLQEE